MARGELRCSKAFSCSFESLASLYVSPSIYVYTICVYECEICGSFQIKNPKQRIEELKEVSLCVLLVNLPNSHITDTGNILIHWLIFIVL